MEACKSLRYRADGYLTRWQRDRHSPSVGVVSVVGVVGGVGVVGVV